MALPASGAISFNNINTELAVSGTTQRGLNDAAVRTLFGQASGAVDMNTGHGKSNSINLTVASNTANYNIRTAAGNPSGVVTVNVTVNSGVWVYDGANATWGMYTGTGWAAGSVINIINNGKIVGYGGYGGSYNAYVMAQTNGGPGAHALYLGWNVNITNNGMIAGGGGGQGGGIFVCEWNDDHADYYTDNGGDGGGGQGWNGGAAVAVGGYGYPATAGSYAGPGLGGTMNNTRAGGTWGTAGGAGLGQLEGTGVATGDPSGEPYWYGWFTYATPGAGGAAGRCCVRNGYTPNWITAGTRYGADS